MIESKKILYPKLEEVLLYENNLVLERFMGHYQICPKETRRIFKDLLRWLWLCAVVKMDRQNNVPLVPDRLVITDSIIIIDEMWHNFLCCTYDYQDFCQSNFGFFIHHFPTSKSKNKELLFLLESNPELLRKRWKLQFNYIYDKLGEKTLIRWYETYDAEYSRKSLQEKYMVKY